MSKFCIHCGKMLEEGEVCSCQANAENTQQQGNIQQGGYQQNQPGTNGYYQQGRPGENGYYQQNQPGANGYYQPGENGYYQQNQPGQPGGNGYYQQNQQGTDGHYQPGQPGANGYYQPGMNGYYTPERRPEMDWINDKAKRLATGTKNMFAEILPVLKAPITRGRELMDSGSSAVGIEFIVTKAIVAIIVLLIAVMKVKGMMGDYAEYVDIPYFGLIFTVVVLTAGLDFLEAVIMHLLTMAFRGTTSISRMLSLTGVRALYHSISLIVFGLFVLVSGPVAMIAGLIMVSFSTYLEHHLYVAGVACSEDRKLYAFLLEKICFVVVTLLVFMMFGEVISKMPMPYRF